MEDNLCDYCGKEIPKDASHNPYGAKECIEYHETWVFEIPEKSPENIAKTRELLKWIIENAKE